MNGTVIPMKIGDKGVVYVELTYPEAEGPFPAASAEDLTQLADGAFERLTGTIKTYTEGLYEQVVNALPEELLPQEIQLEFGVGFDAEVNALIVKTSGEASIKVSMTWKDC